jgi:hypothetical protein
LKEIDIADGRTFKGAFRQCQSALFDICRICCGAFSRKRLSPLKPVVDNCRISPVKIFFAADSSRYCLLRAGPIRSPRDAVLAANRGGGEGEMSDLVAVAAYLTPVEAHILRGRLEADGIFAAVIGAETGTNAPWIATGGVRVLVRQEDFAQALKIKRECESSS